MGNTIRANAAAADKIRDARVTRARAKAKGAPYEADANTYLDEVVTIAATQATDLATSLVVKELVAGELAVADARADDVVLKGKDDLWNDIGRPSADSVFNRIYVKGGHGYLQGPREFKPRRLRRLAVNLVTFKHPRIPKDVAAAHAARVRQAADELEQKLQAAKTAEEAHLELRAAYFANATQAQIQLVRLKKHWWGDGVGEVEIHTMIPDRPAGVKIPMSLQTTEDLIAAATAAMEFDAVSAPPAPASAATASTEGPASPGAADGSGTTTAEAATPPAEG